MMKRSVTYRDRLKQRPRLSWAYSLVSAVLLISIPTSTAVNGEQGKPSSSNQIFKASVDTRNQRYDFEQVRQLIQRELKERSVPSIAVAVAKDGKILWEEGFGWADRERRVPATVETVYSLASLTKPYTATAVMELVAERKIDLDAPIDKYIAPAAVTQPVEWSKATVRQVLAHTAGLPTFYHFYYEDSGDPKVSRQETICRYAFALNPPGKVWEYSNLGYGILDFVISRISGLSWTEYMRAHVFVPLGLRHTSVGVTPGLRKLVAPRYDDQTHQRLPQFDFDHPGASAIYADVHDVISFGMFQLKNHLPNQRAVLTDSAIDEMMRPANLDAASGAQHKTLYGLGWQIEKEHGYQTVGHEGAMVGSTSILKLFPTENLAIAVLANTFDESSVIDVQQKIAAAILPEYAAYRAPAPAQRAPLAPTNQVAELAGHWTGQLRTWQSTIPITLDYKPDGDIHVKIGDQVEGVLGEIRYRNGNLMGRFAGTIPTTDVLRHPHSVALSVWIEGDKMRGEASAITWDTELNYFELPSYVELSRAEGRK